jgi:hypothetical protein
MPADVADLGVTPSMLVSKTLGLNLVTGDVFIQEEGGGAGLGDPLERSSDQVGDDVRDGYVTRAAARSAYGVVVGDDGDVDAEATDRERDRIREQRRGWGCAGDGELERLAAGVSLRPLQPSVGTAELDTGEVCVCERCRSILGDVAEGFRAHAAVRETEAGAFMAAIGGYAEPRSESPQVHVREHACPGCGTLLAVDVVVAEELAA